MSAPGGVRTRVPGGVGESVRRPDGVPKVTGEFAYGSDLWDERMLIGATLRSPHPFATIRSIDVAGALALPGVHAVLRADDVPGDPNYGLEFRDQPVLASDVVRYEGEPIAIVAAESPELAARALGLIQVDYEVREPLTDMERALAPDAPMLHRWGNVVRHLRIEHGDPDVDADVWVEGYYETGMQDQAPLGPEAGLAVPAGDGGVDLYVDDAVAARGPAADRSVPPAPRGQGPAPPGRRRRGLRRRARTSTCRSTRACSRCAPAAP